MRTLICLLLMIVAATFSKAQTAGIPEIKLRTLDGNTISSQKIFSADSKTIVVFWKSNSTKC